MINREATIRWKGYDPDDLAMWSDKRVCCVCDECGRVNWTAVHNARRTSGLCRRCSQLADRNGMYGKTGENSPLYGRSTPLETRLKQSEANSDTKHPMYGKTGEKNPNFGRKHGEEVRKRMRENHADVSGINNPRYGKHCSDETKKKISDAKKGKYAGDKSPAWKGGVSFEPYCTKFNNAFKESIREKFDRICFLCPKTEVENGRKLDVHHVEYDKNCLCDDVKCEFVPLCMSCHAKTNFNQEYWQNLILKKLGVIP